MEGLPTPQIPEVFFFGALNGTKPLWKMPWEPSMYRHTVSILATVWEGKEGNISLRSLGAGQPATRGLWLFVRPCSQFLSQRLVCEHPGETGGARQFCVALQDTQQAHCSTSKRKTPEWSVLKCSPNSSRSSCDAGGKGNQAGAHVLGRHTLSQK